MSVYRLATMAVSPRSAYRAVLQSFSRLAVPVVAMLAVSGLTACSSVTETTRDLMSSVGPYKVEVVQGNFVSSEQVALLKPGMTRNEVKETLGTPLLTDIFHADRWDYVFSIKRKGVEEPTRRLSVFFKGDLLDRFEGDTMPSETEFVASIRTRKTFDKAPNLEVDAEKLPKGVPNLPAARDPANQGATSSVGPSPVTYPPLELPSR